jgi:hypothetical protein
VLRVAASVQAPSLGNGSLSCRITRVKESVCKLVGRFQLAIKAGV